MRAALIFCNKHGIGDELSLAGPIVSALLRSAFHVCIWTHHSSLYQHPAVEVHDWCRESRSTFEAPPCDLGLCVFSRIPGVLPIEYDRTPVVAPICERNGWRMLDGDGRSDGHDFATLYHYSTWVVQGIGLRSPAPPWDFLPSRQSEHVLINPFGWGDSEKGLPHEFGWEVVRMIADGLPSVQFLVVRLPCHPLPSWGTHPPNLRVDNAAYGDSSATEAYCTACLVVTAEGGGYHIAHGAGVPALLVTSAKWFAYVREFALPPSSRNFLLFDYEAVNHSHAERVSIAKQICSWILQNVKRHKGTSKNPAFSQ